jgi:methenyltetrahydrofolate cyclohydrolase
MSEHRDLPEEQSVLDLRVADLLDAVAAREPAPGGGAVAALAVALAAGLVAMANRFSEADPGPAERLRALAAGLADADGAAYDRYLLAARSARTSGDAGSAAAARSALSDATDVPLAVVEVAAEVTVLAQDIAATGNPRLRGDAATAALLASAAAGAAATLVRENVGADDPRAGRAGATAARAHAAADAVSR